MEVKEKNNIIINVLPNIETITNTESGDIEIIITPNGDPPPNEEEN